jgi:hypothetical protein
LWRFSWSGFDALDHRHEHPMFIGAAPLLAITVALSLHRRGRTTVGPLFVGVALSICLLVALTLSVDGWSLYSLMAGPLGVNFVRSVTRIVLVLLFPVSMLFASAVDAIMAARIARNSAWAWLVPIAGLLVVECSDINHRTSAQSVWQQRIDDAAAELPKTLPESPILLLGPRPGEPTLWRELDGMLLAQERGWPTLNGASGSVPAGHVVTGDCRDGAAALSGALDFLGQPGTGPFDTLARRVVFAGYDRCDPSWRAHRLPVTRFAGLWPTDLMAGITVSIESVQLRNDAPVIELTIGNRGDLALPGASSTGTPIQIAARYLPAGNVTPESVRGARWQFRQNLASDVPPGGSLRVTVPLVAPAPVGGPYLIAVSLVQGGSLWFDDHGMGIAISNQTITRDASLHLSDRLYHE